MGSCCRFRNCRSPQPFRAGLTFGGRPSGPHIHSDFAVSFLSQLAIGKLAARDDNSIWKPASQSPNRVVIPTGAQRSGEPALSEVEGDLRFLFRVRQGKRNGGASPFFFGPGTLGRTSGTRPTDTRPVLTGFVAMSGLDCARSSSCLRQSRESTKYLDSRQFSSTITWSSR